MLFRSDEHLRGGLKHRPDRVDVQLLEVVAVGAGDVLLVFRAGGVDTEGVEAALGVRVL